MLRQDTPTLRFLVKGVLLAVGASLVTTTAMHEQDAYALGMQSFVQGMFSATSSPVLANTGNGYTLTGGYAEIRTPLSGANIISFSPPDISAGCGGINLYMGSFHFVNGQEFLALLRTVGQEALGYAFQLAIDAMCHQCGALLASIQKAITAMNNALHNTCQLAQGIYPANKIIGDFAQVGHQAEKTMAANEGDFSDFFGSSNSADHEGVLSHIADTFANNISESINGTTVTKKEPQSAMTPLGNMFWKAIDNSQAYQLLSNIEAGTTTNSVDTKEILMSMAGTEIARPSAGKSGNIAESSMQYQSTNSTPNAANSKNTQTVDPNLFLPELVNGTATAPVDTCQTWTSANGHTYSATSGEMSCEQVDVGGTTLGQLGYEGIGKHINHMMYGGGPGNHLGLVNYMIQGTALSTAQQKFAGTVPSGILSLMHEAEPNKNLITTIGKKVAPILVDEYAVKLGEAIMTAESSVYNGNSHVVIPSNYHVAMTDLERDVNMYSEEEAIHENVMNELTAMVRNYRASLAESGAGPQ
ncbi:conjugal transfer protein TraH [Acidithiobacillus thiooxidans]|uniref:conjugal transfer protein TraH n=1 Tax=Acidithiobacillus thiooxidans TaxID=930 RepID=UPI0002D554EA|nr:conjugal transfer protein TraH [Acidithiobacillus thiooxidans]MBU2792174.1 conjugal transfer protein TraH [Acidithiobacillus thiooxidans]MBU2811631.1 conjugal transfer protein TraH [Acidithiobacillus thiooxidans]